MGTILKVAGEMMGYLPDDPPFVVIKHEEYKTMMNKLKNNSNEFYSNASIDYDVLNDRKYVKTWEIMLKIPQLPCPYYKSCPIQQTYPHDEDCICECNINFLQDGNIVRYVGGIKKNVVSASKVLVLWDDDGKVQYVCVEE